MKPNYKKALQEVYMIINQLEKQDFDKLPKSFLKMVERERNKQYKCNISFEVPLSEQELLEETKAILAVIYRLYLSE